MKEADDRRPKSWMAPQVGIVHLGVSIPSVVHLAYQIIYFDMYVDKLKRGE